MFFQNKQVKPRDLDCLESSESQWTQVKEFLGQQAEKIEAEEEKATA